MKRDISRETVNAVFGYQEAGRFQTYSRTPLHIDFSPTSAKVPSKRIDVSPERVADIKKNKALFNAVGSLAVRDSHPQKIHLPVLDVDGGAEQQDLLRMGSKVILRARHRGKYHPTSLLRDVLGDHDISLEVFEQPNEEYSRMYGEYIDGMRVGALVLRSKSYYTFDVVDSTQGGHSHVYIQQPFEADAHTVLIDELTKTGVVSESWRALVDQEGMGIVRTPWTEKEIHHSGS